MIENSTLIQDFQLYSPTYLRELINNVAPAARINNIVPFAFCERNGASLNPLLNNGVDSWYYGWFTIRKAGAAASTTFLRGLNDNLIYDALTATVATDPNQRSFFGLVTRWVVAPADSISFVGWKVDMYRITPVAAGNLVNFLRTTPSVGAGQPFGSSNNLTPLTVVFGFTVTQITMVSGVPTGTISLKLPYLGGAIPDNDYSLITNFSMNLTVFNNNGIDWTLTYDVNVSAAVRTAQFYELGRPISTGANNVAALCCPALPTTFYVPRTDPPGTLFYTGMPISDQPEFGLSGTLPNFIKDPTDGTVWGINNGGGIKFITVQSGVFC